MNIVHADLRIELPDEWLHEAGMLRFVPESSSYLVDSSTSQSGSIFEVSMADVAPVRRSHGVPIFNADSDTGRTARERVVSILRGFRSGKGLPPIKVVVLPNDQRYRYRLVDGAHRFYCSLALGFSTVPVVTGFDWTSLNQ